MAIQSSGLSLSMAALSARLLEEREVLPRARITAQILADALPGSAVNVYAVTPLPDGDVWTVMATAGEGPSRRAPFRYRPERLEFWRATPSPPLRGQKR